MIFKDAEDENQEHMLFIVLIQHGIRPICNEHLEGQRGDSAYITAEVGTALAASSVRTEGLTHVLLTKL